jgi:hypothetical protein
MARSDLELAQALLGGSVEHDADGRLRLVYLDEGTAKELAARRALARLLRSTAPLSPQIRSTLAGMLDPDATWLEQRKISFPFRRRGKPADHAAAIQVFIRVNDMKNSGATVTGAIAKAAQEFSITEEMVKKCWLRYSRLYGLRTGRHRRRAGN